MKEQEFARFITHRAYPPLEQETRGVYLDRIQKLVLCGENAEDFILMWIRKFDYCGEAMEAEGLAVMDGEEIEYYRHWFALPEVLGEVDPIFNPQEWRQLRQHSHLMRFPIPARVAAFKERLRTLGFMTPIGGF